MLRLVHVLKYFNGLTYFVLIRDLLAARRFVVRAKCFVQGDVEKRCRNCRSDEPRKLGLFGLLSSLVEDDGFAGREIFEQKRLAAPAAAIDQNKLAISALVAELQTLQFGGSPDRLLDTHVASQAALRRQYACQAELPSTCQNASLSEPIGHWSA